MNNVEKNTKRVEVDELRFKQVDGIVTAATSWGDDEVATVNVIAVHGFLDSASSFETLSPLLVEQSNFQIRIVCLDLSGHGKSDHRTEPAIYHLCWITEIINVADALGWDTFCLIGHSMGAAIVITLAGAIPHRVKKLILLDGIGSMGVRADKSPIILEAALAHRRQLLNRQARVYPSYAKLVERIRESESQLSERAARLLADRDSNNVQGGMVFAHDPRLKGSLNFIISTEEIVLAYIRRIACPVMVIWATHRWYPMDEERNRRREREFKNITVKVAEGNHHVHLEHPDRVLPFILPFLLESETMTAKL